MRTYPPCWVFKAQKTFKLVSSEHEKIGLFAGKFQQNQGELAPIIMHRCIGLLLPEMMAIFTHCDSGAKRELSITNNCRKQDGTPQYKNNRLKGYFFLTQNTMSTDLY